MIYAHRLAYELKNGAIPDGLWVLHRCDNPACCNADHLFLGTHSDNMQDMVSKGRSLKGNDSPHAKLSEANVGDIRRRIAAGETQAAIARSFGVSQQHVSKINAGSSRKRPDPNTYEHEN